MHVLRMEAEAARINVPAPARQKSPALHIGCSGWFYWDWKDKFYPSQLPTSEWFGYYAEHFDTVELNASFYSWPTIATVKSWIRQTKEQPFVYTVKVCELITHVKQLKGTKELVKDFVFISDVLGPKMGCFLFQLPPSYRYTSARLKTIVAQMNPGKRNVVEFRHKSWWNDTVYEAFKKAGIIFCSCSGPRLPPDLIKTADDIYVRFHGVSKWYRYDYTDEELAAWADKIKKSKARNVWVYFNNDYEANAPKNAATLRGILEK